MTDDLLAFRTPEFQILKKSYRFTFPGEKKIETTIENCPKSTIANYKRLQI